MKKGLFIGLFLLINIFCVSASSINYTIIDDKVLVEIAIDSTQNLEYKLPYDYKALQINNQYKLQDNIIKIHDANNLLIKYITQTPIEKATTKSFFIISNPFLQNLNEININLPKGATLSQDYVVFPKNYELKTNGRNIILNWKDFSESEILVSYEEVNNDYNLILYFFIILILVIITYIVVKKKKPKQKKQYPKKSKPKVSKKEELKKSLTKNLFEDEKKIIEYLIDKKDNEAWTKEIVRDLNISKVKLSRKLRSLSQKELIKKIPFGNENRIKLRK